MLKIFAWNFATAVTAGVCAYEHIGGTAKAIVKVYLCSVTLVSSEYGFSCRYASNIAHIFGMQTMRDILTRSFKVGDSYRNFTIGNFSMLNRNILVAQ